jgi:hypothetical protein
VINDRIKNKIPVSYPFQQELFIKKIDAKLDKNSKIKLIPLPKNELITMLSQPNGIYFLIQDLFGNPGKIYKYYEKLNKLQLLTDTLNNSRFSDLYFHALNDREFILYRHGRTYNNNQSRYPDLLYCIKNGKVVSHSELKKIYDECFASDFRVIDNKLYIYFTNTFGGDIVVKIWDYEKGVFW